MTKCVISLALGFFMSICAPRAVHAAVISLIDVEANVTIFSINFQGTASQQDPTKGLLVSYSESQIKSELVLQPAFDLEGSDQRLALTLGQGNWDIKINLNFFENVGDDILSISGTWQHVTGKTLDQENVPHPGDEKTGSLADFILLQVSAEASDEAQEKRPDKQGVQHKRNHSDRGAQNLTVNVDLDGDEITGFLFRQDLDHQQVPIPEPTTVALLGSGLAAVAARVRKRRR